MDNIKKTMFCVKLEKDYNHLKGISLCVLNNFLVLTFILFPSDKIAEIERESEKRRNESNLLLQNALDEISSHLIKCSSENNSKACERNLADPKFNERNPNDIPERQKLLKARYQE